MDDMATGAGRATFKGGWTAMTGSTGLGLSFPFVLATPLLFTIVKLEAVKPLELVKSDSVTDFLRLFLLPPKLIKCLAPLTSVEAT